MIDIENYCVCKQRPMEADCDQLLKQIKVYRNDMVARNYPYQRISDIITKWEMKKVSAQVSRKGMKDFLEELKLGSQKENKYDTEPHKERLKSENEYDFNCLVTNVYVNDSNLKYESPFAS